MCVFSKSVFFRSHRLMEIQIKRKKRRLEKLIPGKMKRQLNYTRDQRTCKHTMPMQVELLFSILIVRLEKIYKLSS